MNDDSNKITLSVNLDTSNAEKTLADFTRKLEGLSDALERASSLMRELTHTDTDLTVSVSLENESQEQDGR